MKPIETPVRITLKNVLFLTDFSEPSEAALPFALSIARAYDSRLYAVHVITPESCACGNSAYAQAGPELIASTAAAADEAVQQGMQRVDSQMTGRPHETITLRDLAVWPAVERILVECNIDLIVLGTHGRTGAMRLLMGSVAEEIFRQSPVPILTIGPHVRGGIHGAAQFHRVLFATDFSAESLAALPYATSLAQENQARLTLLHVISSSRPNNGNEQLQQSLAGLLGTLHELVPKDAELWCRPEPLIEYGAPGECIVRAAKQHSADLIVLGVRGSPRHVAATTHAARTTAHQVVAHAECPVLTVRGWTGTA